MKIICKDNFARENVSERLVADNIPITQEATVMKDALQEKFGGHESQEYFTIVADNYKLYKFEP